MKPLLLTLRDAVWLAEQACGVLLYYPLITVALSIAAIVACIFNFPFMSSRFRWRHLFIFASLMISAFILLWGSIMRHEDDQTLAPAWPWYMVIALLVIQVWMGIVGIWLMKGYRWFALAAVLLQEWFGLACAFVATMSVTGDWL